MTKTTKILLAISLTGFAIGCTTLLWGIGTPVGAIFLGFFLISKLLAKEVALFDQEERERFDQAKKESPHPNTAKVEAVRLALAAAARVS